MNMKHWVYDAVPFKRKSAADWVLPALAGMGVGICVGVGLGLIYAPDTGEETRMRLREGASRVKERAQRLADRARGELANKTEQLQSELGRS